MNTRHHLVEIDLLVPHGLMLVEVTCREDHRPVWLVAVDMPKRNASAIKVSISSNNSAPDVRSAAGQGAREALLELSKRTSPDKMDD